MIHNDPLIYAEPPLPVGTTYTITSSGTWTCPATGQWQIELHGGGGGGGMGRLYNTPWGLGFRLGGGGGGSGLLQTVKIRANYPCSITIGLGGDGGRQDNPSEAGGSTSIIYAASTQLVCSGGLEGGNGSISEDGRGGAASGNIASDGDGRTGGYGNVNKPEQTYGNGGAGGSPYEGSSGGAGGSLYEGSNGQPGAAILTYLGK